MASSVEPAPDGPVIPATIDKATKNGINPHFPDELVNRCPEMEIML